MPQISVEQAIQIGIEHHKAGRLPEAERLYRQVLALFPDHANALRLLGIVLMQMGQARRAVELIARAIEIDPHAAEYHVNLGNALKAAGDFAKAIEAYRQALRMRAGYHQAHYNLGVALADQKLWDEAIAAYRDALRLVPEYPEALNNLGAALEKKGQTDEAAEAYRRALQIKPDYAEAWHNLGHLLADLGQPDDAVTAYRRAIELAPAMVGAHWNLSLSLLLLGDFRQGWAEYEWRWQSDEFPTPRRNFTQPQWDGGDLNGRTLLLHTEQGFGDAIQFIRYAPLVARRGGRVILACQPEMMSVMRGVRAIDQIVTVDHLAELPAFDVHCPLMSLPLAFATRLESIPCETPYITVDASHQKAWSAKMAPGPPGLRVGLVWSGRTRTPEQRKRALGFSQLAPLWQAQSVAFYSLQKGEAALQAAGRGSATPMMDLAPELHDFSDTAAAISQLDLVITVDTAVAHLAGAMGKPVWILLSAIPDWRWMLVREDSPWYPTMRLFRQASPGDWAEVIDRVAVALKTRAASLGNALADLGQHAGAIEALQQYLRARPDAEVFNNLGNLLGKAGRPDDAIAAYRRAIELKGDVAVIHFNLGILLAITGQIDQAVAAYETAVRLAPQNPDFRNTLGLALVEARQFTQAASAFREALRLKSENPAVWLNLGNALVRLEQPDEAIAAFESAIDRKPDFPEGHHNLGYALASKGRFAEAIAAYREAIRLKPDYPDAYHNLGNALMEIGRLDDAATAHEQATRLRPQWADPHWNRGLISLLQGDFERGWPQYEWRLKLKGFLTSDYPMKFPMWDGSDFRGRTILLWTEQGFGDAIQFIRYAPLVAARGGRVILKCQGDLGRLMQGAGGVHQIIADEPVPPFDFQCPLLSLPRVFATRLGTIPAAVPYLKLDQAVVNTWGARLGQSSSRLRVGLVWAGNATQKNDKTRSVRLSQLAPLARSGRTAFYSLQKGDAAAQAAHPPPGMELIDLTTGLHDFADTASLIAHLDLVIAVDTAVAHLAGALGKPVWVLVSSKPDWRWLLEREDSPWYPTMRLFRQTRPGDWAEVIERVAEALDRLRSNEPTGETSAKVSLVGADKTGGISEITAEQAIASAIQHYQAGRLSEAESVCRQIREQRPNDADVLHLLGVVVHQAGRHAEAAGLVRQAIAIAPNNPAYYSTLSAVCRRMSKLDEAVDACRRAIELKPDYSAAYNNLGNILRHQKRFDEAIASFRKAIELDPKFVEAYSNLGHCMDDLENLDGAVAAYSMALQLKPDAALIHANLAHTLIRQEKFQEAVAASGKAIQLQPGYVDALNLQGRALSELGKREEAVAVYSRSAQIKPDHAETHNNLGNLYIAQGKFGDAFSAFERAIALDPASAEAQYNLGLALTEQGKLDAAIEVYYRALKLKPDFASAYTNLGYTFELHGKMPEAVAAYRQALRLSPDAANAHMNLGMNLLLQGDFTAGWAEYEWRLRRKGISSAYDAVAQPRWDGSPLGGSTIVLHTEQGFGDTIQFIRYAPLVASRGLQVIVDCQPELHRLLQNAAGVSRVITAPPLPGFDRHLPLLSLPLLFETRLETIPARVPYLHAAPNLAAAWAARMGPSGERLRIGLAWAGQPSHREDRKRSIPLSVMAPLGKIDGIVFYSLQKGQAAAQAAQAPDGMKLIDLTAKIEDFADTAALISNLDLIISVDTSVAHLAGALGKPVWVLLQTRPDWRWLLERQDSPWYPTLRLFRQTTFGDWAEVIERVGQALANWRGTKHP